jgi:hypothetical protein
VVTIASNHQASRALLRRMFDAAIASAQPALAQAQQANS